ncbi:MAG: DcaP family trimeric outer membrane transporter [Salinisphaera sp.]|jgi:hypothetical protein|nr:DcaP family trimeric outer membrane transporter [Salinisphaera sp.]
MSTNSCRSTKVGTAVKRVWGTTVAVPLLLAVMPIAAQAQQSDAQNMQDMQNQIHQLQLRVTQMQQQQKQQAELQLDQKKSPKAKAGNDGFTVAGTTFGLSGYIKLDGVYNFDQNAGASVGASSAVGVGKNGNRFGMTAKQSRLTISSDTPTSMGDVKGTIQMDFYGGTGGYDGSFAHGYTPRVRLAFFTWNNWEFGKDWTTFSDFNYGTTLDFYGPEAQIFRRHAQVRYTFNLPNSGTLDVALESPYDQSLVDNAGNKVQNAVKAPDFVMRYKGSAGNLSYQFAGVARYLRGSNANGNSKSAFGYGLDAGGSYKLATGTTLMATVNYGKGDGAYVYDPAGGADAYISSNGSLDTITRYGYVATLSQALTPKLTTNLVWGQGFAKGYGSNRVGQYDSSSSLFVNLLYNVVKPLTVGAEFGHFTYSNDQPTGHTNRLQVSAIYNF